MESNGWSCLLMALCAIPGWMALGFWSKFKFGLKFGWTKWQQRENCGWKSRIAWTITRCWIFPNITLNTVSKEDLKNSPYKMTKLTTSIKKKLHYIFHNLIKGHYRRRNERDPKKPRVQTSGGQRNCLTLVSFPCRPSCGNSHENNLHESDIFRKIGFYP